MNLSASVIGTLQAVYLKPALFPSGFFVNP